MRWARFWPVSALGGAVLTSPAIYSAFVAGRLDPQVAMLRFVLGMVLCCFACTVIAGIVEGYQTGNEMAKSREKAGHNRRRSDQSPDGDEAAGTSA